MTPSSLIALEFRYSGGETSVPMRTASPHDHRTPEQVSKTKMLSGYRMANRGYAGPYAEHLGRLDRDAALTVVEVGVLLGVGLAMWCDIFPKARVIGLEFDLRYWEQGLHDLTRRGAFSMNKPEVHSFDKLEPDTGTIEGILGGDEVDVLIDDAVHGNADILKCFADFRPHLAERFLFFAEDNWTVCNDLRALYPDLQVTPYGPLTVVQ